MWQLCGCGCCVTLVQYSSGSAQCGSGGAWGWEGWTQYTSHRCLPLHTCVGGCVHNDAVGSTPMAFHANLLAYPAPSQLLLPPQLLLLLLLPEQAQSRSSLCSNVVSCHSSFR